MDNDFDEQIKPRIRTNKQVNFNPQFDQPVNNQPQQSAGWSFEYKIWIFIIGVIVILLVVLLLWFVFRNDVEQNHQFPYKRPPAFQQQYPPPPQQLARQQVKRSNTELEDIKKSVVESNNEPVEEKFGPVPGILPDNPLVVGISPEEVKQEESPGKLPTIPEEPSGGASVEELLSKIDNNMAAK